MPKKLAHSEEDEQAALIVWAHYQTQTIPELEWLLAIPNGGKRSMKTGVALKKSGTKKGVPDLFLPIVRGGFSGLWIEMKSAKGSVTKEQKHWLDGLAKQGYQTHVCRSWTAAKDIILEYLS